MTYDEFLKMRGIDPAVNAENGKNARRGRPPKDAEPESGNAETGDAEPESGGD